MSFFKIGVDLNGMSASEYLSLYQYFTNRTHIRNGRRFDQSEISQIIEKNICCSVILSGLIQLKSIPRTEYIVLPYNTRASTLWTPFDGGILGCQKRTIQSNAYTTSNKSFGVQKLTPPLELRVDELLSKWLRLEKLRGQSDYRDLYFIDDTINEHYPNR